MFKNPNLSDINGSSGAMDEDGEFAPEDSEGEVNEPLPEADHSPLINGLAVKVTHPEGMEQAQTTVVATLHAGVGIESKRLVLPGEVTAQKLAGLLRQVASW